MMHDSRTLKWKPTLAAVLTGLAALVCTGCGDDEEQMERSLGFDEFVPKYNNYIKSWLSVQHAQITAGIKETEEKLLAASEEEKKELESGLADQRRALERVTYRQQLGDYFAFKKEEDLPDGLKWKYGMDQPEIGDSRAKKGGVFNDYMMEFPATVRHFGKESNNSFRGRIYDEIELGLIGLHPRTSKVIPGIAKRWAVSEDGRTVFYELDSDATYNDGVKIGAKDFMVAIYLRVSDYVTAPYEKQYYREQFAQVAVYGDKVVAVSRPEPKPLMPYYCNLRPAAPHFYEEYGADYADRYQWRVAPHAGAYFVRDEDIVKGVSITLTRAKDWWAKDKKYYRYMFNPDKIRYTTIRDKSKAFELFRAGQIDMFSLTEPVYWYQKSEIEPVFKGYIERYKFYNQYPRVPRGAYMNAHRPMLQDTNTRKGIAHALNWQKVIDVVFRGDFARLPQFSSGFGEMTDPSIRPREYSVLKAREYFKQAGYTVDGEDGFLRKPGGEKLSVSLTYARAAFYPKVVAVLKEEARKAGLELIDDGLEPTVAYKKVMKKEHDMTIWGWGATPPFPVYYQFFFSKNALNDEGQPKPQTNNINVYSSSEMDVFAKAVRNARTLEEVKKNSWAAQKLVYEEAIFSAAWMADFQRVGCWRWVKWPDTRETPFMPPIVPRPDESYVYWIDDDVKKETQQAMRSGKTFPEVQKVIDVFKDGIPPLEDEGNE